MKSKQIDDDVKWVSKISLDQDQVGVDFNFIWYRNSVPILAKVTIDNDIKQSLLDKFIKDYSGNVASTDNASEGEEAFIVPKFDIVTDLSGQLASCKKDEYQGVERVLNIFKNEKELGNLSGIELENVKGYCATIYRKERQLYLFGSVNKFNALKKKHMFGFIGNVSSNTLSKISDDEHIIGINPSTVCYISGNNVVIKIKQYFESIFNLSGEYRVRAEGTIKALKKHSDFFKGIDQIDKDAKSKFMAVRGLAKMSADLSFLDEMVSKKDKVIRVIQDPIFNKKLGKIKVSKDNQSLEYSKDAIFEFVNLLGDHAVVSAITGNHFFAEKEQ